jgi:hypothetical protein
MKNLLYKELKLCLNPQLIIFACFSVFVLIPDWPSAVAFIYILAGLATVFPRALADKDIMYSVMLPVRKGDIVKGKLALIVLIEAFSILISIPAAVVKALFIDPALIGSAAANGSDPGYIAAVSPNMVAYGSVLLAFGVYALILIPWYYRNPAKVNWPQLVSMLAASLILGLGIGLQALVPALHADVREVSVFWIQFAYLFGGFLVYVFFTYLAERLGEKAFAKVDL